MKKSISLIIGVIIGITLIIVQNYQSSEAIYSNNFEDELMLRDLRWSDIFGPRKDAMDLYKLVYSNLSINPEVNALKDSAQKFGLTVSEAEKIVNGSVSGLIHNPSKEYNDISYQTLYDEYSAINEYFNETIELYTLREEMSAISLPNEIFSNGDLRDSGFDLIDDYRQMQKILFGSESEISTGFDFGLKLSSPNIDALSGREILEIGGVPEGSPINTQSEDNVTNDVSNIENEASSQSVDILNEVKVDEILEEDICEIPEESKAIKDSISNFEENKKEEELKNAEDGDNFTESENQNKNDDALSTGYSPFSDDGDINPAKRSGWGGSFCPDIIPATSKSGDGYAYLAGQNGFESLSYFGDSLLSGTLSAGAATALGGENLSLKIAVCFSTELIYKTYSTYMPSQSCIKCEVDRINETLNSILSHSLIPNKVTGNYMESSKCKDGLSLVPSLNIIAIPSPISTPMNMDMISEKNIFEEWNDFVSEYHPFLSGAGQIPGDFERNFVLENAPEDTSLTEVMIEANNVQNNNLADALEKIEAMNTSLDLADKNMYASEFFLQIRQFSNMFKSIELLIKDIETDALSKIKDKPNI